MTKEELMEEALLMHKALSFLQKNTQIHWQDKKGLIVDYVRYIVSKDICRDRTATISAQRQAGIDRKVAKENIIRYFEKMYGYNCSDYLNLLFGEEGWEHVINDGSINFKCKV